MNVKEIPAHLRSLFTERFSYIDRANIWLDTDRAIIDSETHHRFGRRIHTIRVPMSKFQPVWKQKIQLYQPTPDMLRLIDEDIHRAACGYMINLAELTIDWTTKTGHKADGLHHFLKACFVHGNQRYAYENDYEDDRTPGTSRFAQLGKHKVVPVIYSDHLSKINRKRCAHFEYKLVGASTCKRKNIVTLRQLAEYDIIGFFKENATFCKMPSKHEIGMAICETEQRTVTTRRGYEKVAETYFANHRWTRENLCLQHLLQEFPPLAQYIEGKDTHFHKAIVKALFS